MILLKSITKKYLPLETKGSGGKIENLHPFIGACPDKRTLSLLSTKIVASAVLLV